MTNWASGRGIGSKVFFNPWSSPPKTGLEDDVPDWFESERDVLNATAEIVDLLAHGRIVGAHHVDHVVGEEELVWPRFYNAIRTVKTPDLVKLRAQRKLTWAVASGHLTRQPCEVCGNPKTDGHHTDYSRPLDVRWLCRAHHGQAHAELRRAA